MQVIKPNSSDQIIDGTSVFLAGSIEMGVAEDWQTAITEIFKDEDVTFLNPRRDDWDSSWEQKESNPEFNHQVNWELTQLTESDIAFFNILPDTKSPITLMELGVCAAIHQHVIVCCPTGFWRKGNVDVICSRAGIPVFENFDAAIGALRTKLHMLSYSI
jgi:hypothetical protein